MRNCRFDAAGSVVSSRVVHGLVLVPAGCHAAHSVGDTGHAFQLTRVPGVGNAEASAGACSGDSLGRFGSGIDRRSTAAFSVARSSRTL